MVRGECKEGFPKKVTWELGIEELTDGGQTSKAGKDTPRLTKMCQGGLEVRETILIKTREEVASDSIWETHA